MRSVWLSVGRIFEGDAETMLKSLSKVAELPRNSLIFPGVWSELCVCVCVCIPHVWKEDGKGQTER